MSYRGSVTWFAFLVVISLVTLGGCTSIQDAKLRAESEANAAYVSDLVQAVKDNDMSQFQQTIETRSDRRGDASVPGWSGHWRDQGAPDNEVGEYWRYLDSLSEWLIAYDRIEMIEYAVEAGILNLLDEKNENLLTHALFAHIAGVSSDDWVIEWLRNEGYEFDSLDLLNAVYADHAESVAYILATDDVVPEREDRVVISPVGRYNERVRNFAVFEPDDHHLHWAPPALTALKKRKS